MSQGLPFGRLRAPRFRDGRRVESVKHTLAEWRRQPARRLLLGRIEAVEALQSRARDAVAWKHRHRLDEASELHIARMREYLATFERKELEPLLVAQCGSRLLVVDGFHRLEAYRLAGRGTVPARVYRMDLARAVLVSKLVNTDGAKLPLHGDQALDAAWQFIVAATDRGRVKLPSDLSCRAIAAMFGVSKSTAHRMVEKVPKVDLRQFDDAAFDPGTGWPRWRHVNGNAWRDLANSMPAEERRRRQAERGVARLARLIDQLGPEVWPLTLQLYSAECADEAGSALMALGHVVHVDSDY